MANKDRLTGLDSSFLHLERDSAHMHVAGCSVFDGAAPTYDELLEAIESRLHLVPRYRQRLAFVPLGQGRPVWVDDPHFKRQLPRAPHGAAAPRRRGRAEAARGPRVLPGARPQPAAVGAVAGRRPRGRRFAVLSKTHHALVDGISGVDIATVLFDTSPDPLPVAPPDHEWVAVRSPAAPSCWPTRCSSARPCPAEVVRGVRATLRGPRTVAKRAGKALGSVGALAWTGLQAAPPSPFNVRIGPHRRFTWVRADLAQFKAIKNSLGGTVNDVVLAVVTGALGNYMRLHGGPTEGVGVKAMVPVSVRADIERGALGNRVAAMWATLPVGIDRPGASGCTRSARRWSASSSRARRSAPRSSPRSRASRRRRSWPRRRGYRPGSGSSTSS